jgi:hypothetical protein
MGMIGPTESSMASGGVHAASTIYFFLCRFSYGREVANDTMCGLLVRAVRGKLGFWTPQTPLGLALNVLLTVAHFFGVGIISYHRGSSDPCGGCPDFGSLEGPWEMDFQDAAVIAEWEKAGCLVACDPSGSEATDVETFCIPGFEVRGRGTPMTSRETTVRYRSSPSNACLCG